MPKDVDFIRDNGGKVEHRNLSKPSRDDRKNPFSEDNIQKEDRKDYKDTTFDPDMRVGKIEDTSMKENIKIAKELVKVAKELVIAANAEYDEENEKWLLDHGFKRGAQNYLEINEGRFEMVCFPPFKNDSKFTCTCTFFPINVGGINYAGCEFKGDSAKEAVQGCVNKFRASVDKLRKNVSEMTDALNDALSVVRKF